jgi:hypothetical protein
MEREFSGSSKPLEEIANGALCMIKWRDRSAFAVRGFRASPTGQESFVAILGPAAGDDHDPGPHLKRLNAVDAAHALELSNGRILPELSSEAVGLGWPHEWRAGQLAICGSDLLLFAEGRGGATAINVSTGEVAPEAQRPITGPAAVAYASSWSIVIPLGRDLREIFRYAVAQA